MVEYVVYCATIKRVSSLSKYYRDTRHACTASMLLQEQNLIVSPIFTYTQFLSIFAVVQCFY